jgi:hypothetical protein
VTFVMALALGMMGTARAQVSRSLTVAVLNFSNSSGVQGALLGNKASAAVETQLIESGRYDVVKSDLVQKTMTDLNLTYPLGRQGMTQLAQALEADAIITGDVVNVIRDAKTNQVSVTLRLEMTDRTSGELTNGAIATGESGIRPDFSGAEDVLLDEALSKAAFTAVRSMNERILPEGTVYATSSRGGNIEALLNIGTNSGVRGGMEFIVLRNREQVARLRATEVTATDTTAVVVSSTRGVQPEDKVRAVFRLGDIPVDRGGAIAPASVHKPRMNFGNMALGALALFGLYRVTQGNIGSGNAGARGVTAVATGPNNGAIGSTDFPFVPEIHVRWRPPAGVAQTDIVGYSVYRSLDGPGAPIFTTTSPGVRETIDTGQATTAGDGGDSTSGLLSGNSNGLSPGVTNRYIVRTAYRINSNGSNGGTDDSGTGGTDTGTISYADDKEGTAATGLLPPRGETADLSNASAAAFTFRRVPGGDRYVIQVSDSPDFPDSSTDVYPKSGDLVYPAPPALGPVTYHATIDTTTGACTADLTADTLCGILDPRDPAVVVSDPEFANLYAPEQSVTINLNTGKLGAPTPGGQPFYWRVGVYSSRDDKRPEGGGYVWGDFLPLQSGSTLAAGGPSILPSLINPAGPRHPGVSAPGQGGGAGLPGGGRHDRQR